jgi:hypothetical protein
MSHEHRDYLINNLPALRRVEVDRNNESKRPTTVLNGEGLSIWLVIVENVQANSLYMSLNSLSDATGIAKQNVRKRLAVFVQAGWLIERGYEKHGKYAKTKTYGVVVDVLGVGEMTYSQEKSQGASQGASRGASHGRSRGELRNDATPTEITESSPNPIPNTNPTPTPATHESANNIDNTPSTEAGEMKTRIDNIVSLCIELERNKTPNIGRGLQVNLHRDYSRLAYEELKSREWLTDGQAADVCYAKRNDKTPPQCTRPTCSTCFGSNRDIDGLHGLSTIHNGLTYVVCPKCDGDGFASIKSIAQKMFTNLNTKGITQ